MNKIQIKCDSCESQFAVPESFMGQAIECHTCNAKFTVEEASLVKSKRFYPGEKSNSYTNTYADTSNVTANINSNVSFKETHPRDTKVKYALPTSGVKTLMTFSGILLIIIAILLFVLGSDKNGMLKTLDNNKRLILAGFIALIASGLIIAGAKNKLTGLIISIILAGGLCAMPFIFPQIKQITSSNDPSSVTNTNSPANNEQIKNNDFETILEKYKSDVGFDTVEKTRKALTDPDSLKVIILRDTKVQYTDTILNFFKYSLEAKSPPSVYTAGRKIENRDVTLITFISDLPIQEIHERTKKFGEPQEMNKIRTQLKIVEVIVDDSGFKNQSTEIITNPNHHNYFDANVIELNNIDRDRKLAAVKRLENITKKGRQADIVHTLVSLINKNDYTLSIATIATLQNWTKPKYKTDLPVLEYAKHLVGTKKMTRSVMKYIATKNIPGSGKILARHWISTTSPGLWEEFLILAKDRGEKAVLSTFAKLKESHYKSAANILRKVGSPKSIAPINNLLLRVNDNDKKYFKDAIDEIKSRH